MINENELAKELTATLDKDAVAMPKAAALHLKPNGGRAEPDPTLSMQLDQAIATLDGYIRVLKALKATL